MCVASGRGSCEWCLLYRKRCPRPSVPEKDLPGVGAANDEGRVEGREFGGQYIGGTVEGIFGP